MRYDEPRLVWTRLRYDEPMLVWTRQTVTWGGWTWAAPVTGTGIAGGGSGYAAILSFAKQTGIQVFRLYSSPLSVTHDKRRDRNHPFSSLYSAGEVSW